LRNTASIYGGFHPLFRGIILFGFTMLFLRFIVTQSLLNYIAPKMIPFVYIATCIFFLLSIVQILRSTSKNQAEEVDCDCGIDHRAKGSIWLKMVVYCLFLLPILTGFLLPHKILDSSVAAKRGVQLSLGQLKRPKAPALKQEEFDTSQMENLLTVDTSKGSEKQQPTTKPKEDIFSEQGYGDFYTAMARKLYKEPIIQLDDKNYLEELTTINLFLPQFVGKKMDLEGFVYRGEEMKLQKNEMVTARFAVTCCTADASVVGILIKGESINQFPVDTWVKIKGTIQEKDYGQIAVPSLQLAQAQKVKAPDTPYVY
jgi:putative membrane protein